MLPLLLLQDECKQRREEYLVYCCYERVSASANTGNAFTLELGYTSLANAEACSGDFLLSLVCANGSTQDIILDVSPPISRQAQRLLHLD